MVSLFGFLILFPLAIAVLLLFVKGDTGRAVLVYGGAAAIIIASLACVALNIGASYLVSLSSEIINLVATAIGVLVAIVVAIYAVKYKNILALVLAVIQLAGSLIFDFGFATGIEVQSGLYIDSLSMLMVFIIGVIGSCICIYALGYMQDFQEHAEDKNDDRRPAFFALMFVFLSAMFVIVLSNNMTWMFAGWEVTTLCSFLLIGYTRTAESIANAFRQIIMNILGGIGFLIALFVSAIFFNTLSFDAFIQICCQKPVVSTIALCALAFAGLTKAAQMPFHTWLLGAMVAPTPTSALLHSSTMVKAGVFLLIKLAPAFLCNVVASVLVMTIGAFTFLACSLMAISQSNAKRVLAYSTIANLGLITACAGVGTPEAVWAACFLVLFHAVAKSLLFLCVGTAEHHIGSRDIEAMDLLFERMPKLARFMMLGIMAMFIAPFGMLISKWATLVSFVDSGQIILILLLAFGSAATFLFWAKWLGKLSAIAGQPDNVELTVHKSEWLPLIVMSTLIILASILMPLISDYVVIPYLAQAFSVLGTQGAALLAFSNILSIDNMLLAAVCVAAVAIVLFVCTGRPQKSQKVNVYLSGVTADSETRTFRGALSQPVAATSRNWYLSDWFGEAKLNSVSTIFAITIIVIAFLCALAITAGLLVF